MEKNEGTLKCSTDLLHSCSDQRMVGMLQYIFGVDDQDLLHSSACRG